MKHDSLVLNELGIKRKERLLWSHISKKTSQRSVIKGMGGNFWINMWLKHILFSFPLSSDPTKIVVKDYK